MLCVCPGFTRTGFQDNAEVDTSQLPNFVWMSAADVADQAVRAVGRRPVLVNGTMNSLTATVVRLLPTGVAARLYGAAIKPKAAPGTA